MMSMWLIPVVLQWISTIACMYNDTQYLPEGIDPCENMIMIIFL